jgi:hypothetical protein
MNIFCYLQRVQDVAANLFERVPRGLFGPLGDPHAELYWELLANLYCYEFEREPFIIARQVALEIAENVIQTSALWAGRRQELERLALEDASRQSTNKSTRMSTKGVPDSFTSASVADDAAVVRVLARRILARLESSGWVHFQYRAGAGEIMSFHPYAARILETPHAPQDS